MARGSATSRALRLARELAERGWLPDAAIRRGVRRFLRETLAEEQARDLEPVLAQSLRRGPISLPSAEESDLQRSLAFARQLLGPRLKLSCALFEHERAELPEAEERMLALTCQRAGLSDGMRVLDLGCGWGALALYIGERFPRAQVLAVSSSKLQCEHVLGEVARRGLRRVDVIHADAAHYLPDARFERVFAVELFEHVGNWDALLARIAGWLEPDGSLFAQLFCHRELAHPLGFAPLAALMPSRQLLRRFDRALVVEEEFALSGLHYARTAEAWLARLDAARPAALHSLASLRSAAGAELALARWRLFLLACRELFAFRDGTEWGVTHYRLSPRRRRS
jgi:cyclopropane-fatty-acyl-phospholipid synthase